MKMHVTNALTYNTEYRNKYRSNVKAKPNHSKQTILYLKQGIDKVQITVNFIFIG